VIKLPETDLTASERFALDLLVDLARLLPAPSPLDVVRLELSDQPPRNLRGWIAAGWGIDVADGIVRIPRALLQTVIDVAGAGAEQRSTDRDRYDRVPSSANPLAQEGLEREPVIQRAAVALQEAARKAAGRRAFRTVAPWPQGRSWAAAFTHDLDVVSWWPAFTLLRIAELLRKGALGHVARVAAAAIGNAGFDPIFQGVTGVINAEAAAKIRSTWFILCGTPTLQTMRAGDLTYRPESTKARGILVQVRGAGHEIGLHGSFATLDNHGAFSEQRRRLEDIAGTPVQGIRQHYVRLHPGVTEHAMVNAGFAYDSTFGFPDRNGFRLGVADVVPRWDTAANQPVRIDEVPFTWMDRALSKYRRIEQPSAWTADALELAATARAVGGLWVGLWHPNLTTPLGFPDAPNAYSTTLAGLLAEHPFVGPLRSIAAWRRARRAVRAEAIAADGGVVARTTTPTETLFQLRLEDAAGRTAETLR
jgi:hypothetical protein